MLYSGIVVYTSVSISTRLVLCTNSQAFIRGNIVHVAVTVSLDAELTAQPYVCKLTT